MLPRYCGARCPRESSRLDRPEKNAKRMVSSVRISTTQVAEISDYKKNKYIIANNPDQKVRPVLKKGIVLNGTNMITI